MRITESQFVISIAQIGQYPPSTEAGLPEICVVGRSNVGKSSFINMLTGRRALAKTSQTPGRTRLINLFSINKDEFLLVDLPGYGYAKAPKKDKREWDTLIGGYLETSQSLKLTLLLVDCRHEPSVLDLQMAQYLYVMRLPFVVVATKTDKLSAAERSRAVMGIARGMSVGRDDVCPVSNTKGEGRDKVLARIERALYPEKV